MGAFGGAALGREELHGIEQLGKSNGKLFKGLHVFVSFGVRPLGIHGISNFCNEETGRMP